MTIHRNVLKQKNKPFKNSKKSKAKSKPSSVPLRASTSLGRKVKKSQIIAKKKSLRINLQEESPRNVFVVPFHSNVNSIEFINSLLSYYCSDSFPKCSFSHEGWFISHPILLNSSITHDGIPRRLIFYTCPRNLSDILYSSSCSDILLCLFRGSSSDESSYDEYGYKILSSLRLQGIPTPIGVDLEVGLEGDRQKSCALVKRYFQSEFGLDRKFTTVLVEKDLRTVLSLLGCVSISQLSWRKDRGYMLCLNQNYNPKNKELSVDGYVKGLGFSVRHPVHLTSVGDYFIKRIEILSDICPTSSSNSKMVVERTVEELNSGELSQLLSEVNCLNEVEKSSDYSFKEEDTTELFDSFTTKLSINKIPLGEGEPVDDIEMDQESFHEYEDLDDEKSLSSDDSDDLDFVDGLEDCTNGSKKIVFEKRSLEELSFPDEVDTPIDEPAKERFRKYRSLKNIRSSLWDPYESLPLEYFKINEFENFRATMNSSKLQLLKSCQISNVSGCFVRLTLMNVSTDDFSRVSSQGLFRFPLIISTILPYERKVSVVNFSVNRTSEGPESLPSKTPLLLYCGFRRFPGIPIFSKSINVDRGKRGLYERFFKKGDTCIATIYGMSLSPPTPIIALDEDEIVYFGGNIIGSEPCRVIIKRILLTGYPMKVHKRKAIVRYMFFNPSDIKYFKPVQLFTKKGLRGKILQSLGTHGHMKCFFSDFITQDDIVCLPLYKRVYPKWYPFSWTRQI